MIVFLLHGYPNGIFMYKKLIRKLLKNNHIPVGINLRTGTSFDDNVNLVREIFASYPISEKKAVVAHDWGAVTAWHLFHEFPTFNISHFFVMSISNSIDLSIWNINKIYQIKLVLTKLFPENVSLYLQSLVFPEKHREKQFDTAKSNYYYSTLVAIEYFFSPLGLLPKLTLIGDDDIEAMKQSSGLKIYYISSFEDQAFGFTNENLLSEPIKYQSHFFYIENTKKINAQIVDFLNNRL